MPFFGGRMDEKIDAMRAALFFAIKVVDMMEAEHKPMRVELLFIRAKAQKALRAVEAES